MRNSPIEMLLNSKMQPRYIGPLVIVSCNKGGAYVVCELDGSVHQRPIAAFRLIPYLLRKSIALPLEALDVDEHHLDLLENTELVDE